MRTLRLAVPLLLLLVSLVPRPAAASALDPELFPVPDRLRPNIAFWYSVYSRYTTSQQLLHDREHPGVVYAVLDFTELESGESSEVQKARLRRVEIQRAEGKYRELLERLAAGEAPESTPDLRRVERLLHDLPGGREKYAAAAHRLRTQKGQRDRFEAGIARSGGYLPKIEEIFRSRGVPVAISRLVFVESMFHLEARSSAEAVGIWQFVGTTGRSYLSISSEADDRLDPWLASDAAARLLHDNHELLRSWPLAITAYNYGTNGMRRAVQKLGTRDLGEILERHDSRLFGFASRNFYAEFVAAALVYANRERLFPGVEPGPTVEFEELHPDRWVKLPVLLAAAGVEPDPLRALNPGLSRSVWEGDLLHPAGRTLRVPPGTSETFRAAWKALPESALASHQKGLYYSVRRGDTLGSIASRYGTSVGALQRANGLATPDRIRIGQRLFLPLAGEETATGMHIVRPGETLTRIARRYGTSVERLQALNGIARPDLIRPGQRLRVPGGTAARHRVAPGETLAALARRYRTTVESIQAANRLAGHRILAGQLLVIP